MKREMTLNVTKILLLLMVDSWWS